MKVNRNGLDQPISSLRFSVQPQGEVSARESRLVDVSLALPYPKKKKESLSTLPMAAGGLSTEFSSNRSSSLWRRPLESGRKKTIEPDRADSFEFLAFTCQTNSTWFYLRDPPLLALFWISSRRFSLGPDLINNSFFHWFANQQHDENKITIFQLQFDGRLDKLQGTVLSFSFSLSKMLRGV